MFLSIEEDTLKRLKCLTNFPNEVIEDFCRVSIDGIYKPISRKLISSAAARLSTDEDVVSESLQAITKVFLNAAKMHLSQEDLNISLKIVGFSENISLTLASRYEGGKGELETLLSLRAPPNRTYKDLEWRLDVKVATRSLYDQCQPNFLLKLHTKQGIPGNNSQNENKNFPKNNSDSDNNDRLITSTQSGKVDEEEEEEEEESFVFECNAATLVRVRESLEEAVKEAKLGRHRRVIEHL